MLRAVLTLVLVGASVAAAGLREPAAAEAQGSRIVDRTMLCAVPTYAGARKVKVGARVGTRSTEQGTVWTARPEAAISDLRGQYLFTWVTAGWPPSAEIGRAVSRTTLLFRTQCRVSQVTVPLSAKGLSGGRPSASSDAYECYTGRRVLIRVRARFRDQARLQRDGFDYLVGRGAVETASILMKSETGRAIAFASVSESGSARLLTRADCLPD